MIKRILRQKIPKIPIRSFRTAVLLKSSDQRDKTDVTEAVAVLVALARVNSDVQCFAPPRKAF